MSSPVDRFPTRTANVNQETLMRGYARLPVALKQMGYKELREGQRDPIINILSQRDTLCILPTGSGKTSVFVIPTLCLDWRTLVFSPLTALMRDQVQSLQRMGITAVQMSGMQSEAENALAARQWMAGEAQIFYVAPERLQNKLFKEATRAVAPDMVVLDEAHTLSQWGYTFRSAYMKAGDFVAECNPKVVAAFTATCPPEVEADIRKVLGMQAATRLIHYPIRHNLKLTSREFVGVSDIVRDIQEVGGPTIVYCGTIKKVETIAEQLSAELPYQVSFFHGELPDNTKRSNMDQFMDGYARVMVATNAFGMGVDKADIRLVIHRDHPASPEALAQECVPLDAWVSTSSGIKQAEKVVLGDKMLDYDFSSKVEKTAEVIKTIENKTTSLVEIRTARGSTLRVTPDHPVYVKQGDTLVEVPAHSVPVGAVLLAQQALPPAEIKPIRMLDLLGGCPEPVFVKVKPTLVNAVRGKLSPQQLGTIFRLARDYDYTMYRRHKSGRLDYWLEACAAAGIPVEEFETEILYFKTRSSQKTVLPLRVDSAFAWLAGIMASDGYIYRSDSETNYGSWRLKLGNTNLDIVKRFSDIVTGYGLHVYQGVRESDANSLQVQSMFLREVSSPLLVHVMRQLGVPSGKKSYTVTVPAILRSAPSEIVGAYLAGVIDGDGSLSKIKTQIRIHSASWDFLSGLCMLLRTAGVPATVYPEDYLCKADVMTAAVDHGYSLRVSSTEDYLKVLDWIAPHACKGYKAAKEARAGWAHVLKSRRPTVEVGGIFWLEDPVLETRVVQAPGEVRNWRVEPGNKLVVEGILTHNCGRAGRDGKDSWCITYRATDSTNLQHFFIRNAYPSRGDIEAMYEALRRSAGPDDITHATGEELGRLSGVQGFQVGAIMTILLGNNVIENVRGAEKIAKIRFIGNSETERFQHWKALIERGGQQEDDGFLSVDIEWLAHEADIGKATLTKYLREWDKAGFLRYVAPFRGTPRKIIGTPAVIDYDALEVKKQHSLKKLDAVLAYFSIPDAHKHDYLKKCCTENI